MKQFGLKRGELYLDLIKAHGTVLFLGPEGGAVKSYLFIIYLNMVGTLPKNGWKSITVRSEVYNYF